MTTQKLQCRHFKPLTHPSYGTEGCYGCDNVNIDPSDVWCSEGHWCIETTVPEMKKDSKGFKCPDMEPMDEFIIFLCESCNLLNIDGTCGMNKSVKKTVVRFD